MRILHITFFSLISSLVLVGCSENKNEAYFKQHPDEILATSIECSRLPDKEVLNNASCRAIANLEKPLCEQELKVSGRISTPRGWIYNCNDQYYLIARPIIDAKMKAYITGKPDPVVEYMKNHPQK